MRKVGFTGLLLVVICSLAAVPANADHIVRYMTGGFGYDTFGADAGPLVGPFYGNNDGVYVYGYWSLSPGGTYNSVTQCDQFGDCGTLYWGNIIGGTVTMTAYLPDNTTITLVKAWDIRGFFQGFYGGDCPDCYDANQQSWYSFDGLWSNGWESSFIGSETWDIFFYWDGGFAITTQTTPEPTSIVLLGSGVLGLIGYGRKRLCM
jgi:hypothetical protein